MNKRIILNPDIYTLDDYAEINFIFFEKFGKEWVGCLINDEGVVDEYPHSEYSSIIESIKHCPLQDIVQKNITNTKKTRELLNNVIAYASTEHNNKIKEITKYE